MYYSQEKETIKLKKRKTNFRNDKVALSKQKLQDKEAQMGLSSDDLLTMMGWVV
jgi:hypothetical protein